MVDQVHRKKVLDCLLIDALTTGHGTNRTMDCARFVCACEKYTLRVGYTFGDGEAGEVRIFEGVRSRLY